MGCMVYNFFPGQLGAAGAAVLRFLVYGGALMQVARTILPAWSMHIEDVASTARSANDRKVHLMATGLTVRLVVGQPARNGTTVSASTLHGGSHVGPAPCGTCPLLTC